MIDQTGAQRQQDGDTLEADLPQAPSEADGPKPKRAPQSRDRAAKTAGTSGGAVAQAKRTIEKAPELAEKVANGELSLGAAEHVVRQQAKQARVIDTACVDHVLVGV